MRTEHNSKSWNGFKTLLEELAFNGLYITYDCVTFPCAVLHTIHFVKDIFAAFEMSGKRCGKINLFIHFLNWLSNAESWWGWNPAQNVIGWEVDRYSLFRYIVHCRVKQKGEFLGLCHVDYGTQWDYIFNGRRFPPLGQRCIPLGLSHLLNTSIAAESHYVLSKLNSFYCALFKKKP